MVALLTGNGVRDATVLGIGGGVGEIGLELLQHGAATVTNLELSPHYQQEAAALAAEAGVTGRTVHRLVDICADPAAVEPADIVVLHRVVCCYPDYATLLGVAADHARRQLVLSFPPRTLASRAFVAAQNTLLRRGGRQFRTFAHPPAVMLAVLADHGMQPATTRRGPVWQVAAAGR